MSDSSNGIYILETKRQTAVFFGGRQSFPSTEYRVAYTDNIDEIYGEFDDKTNHWKGDRKAMIRMFKDSPVFVNDFQAWDYARELSTKYDHLEYGVGLITNFKDICLT